MKKLLLIIGSCFLFGCTSGNTKHSFSSNTINTPGILVVNPDCDYSISIKNLNGIIVNYIERDSTGTELKLQNDNFRI